MGCRLGIGRRRNLHVGKITRPVPARSMAGRSDTGYDLGWWPNAEARASYDAAPGLSGRLRWGRSQPGPLAGGKSGPAWWSGRPRSIRRSPNCGGFWAIPTPSRAISLQPPRKGYRLIAPVRPIEPAAPLAPSTPEPPRSRTSRSRWVWIGALSSSALIALIWIAWVPLQQWLPPAEHGASIVVLPFVDMSVEKSDQPFCDGLTEELSNWLAQIPTLRVVARTSAFSFRGLNEDVRDIGKALNANHVLEGSMRRSGDHMRVTVQLIDARNGYHMWSSEYDRPIEDAIRIQEDIARSVADSLEIRLTQDTAERFAERRSVSSEAYRLYLLARHDQQDRTRD